jgi:hypothetical protein
MSESEPGDDIKDLHSYADPEKDDLLRILQPHLAEDAHTGTILALTKFSNSARMAHISSVSSIH